MDFIKQKQKADNKSWFLVNSATVTLWLDLQYIHTLNSFHLQLIELLSLNHLNTALSFLKDFQFHLFSKWRNQKTSLQVKDWVVRVSLAVFSKVGALAGGNPLYQRKIARQQITCLPSQPPLQTLKPFQENQQILLREVNQESHQIRPENRCRRLHQDQRARRFHLTA